MYRRLIFDRRRVNFQFSLSATRISISKKDEKCLISRSFTAWVCVCSTSVKLGCRILWFFSGFILKIFYCKLHIKKRSESSKQFDFGDERPSRLTLFIKKNWNICDGRYSTSKGTVYWICKSPASMQQRWFAYNWKLDPANDTRQWAEQRNSFLSTLGVSKRLSVFNDPMHSSCDCFFRQDLKERSNESTKWLWYMSPYSYEFNRKRFILIYTLSLMWSDHTTSFQSLQLIAGRHFHGQRQVSLLFRF